MAADPAMAARLLIGARLKALREAAGITGGAAAASIGASASKISRLESGHVGVRDCDVGALLALYGASGADQDELLGLARETAKPGFWDGMDQMPLAARYPLSLEAAADAIVTFDSLAVPPLLQTPEYAHALCAASASHATWRSGLGLEILARRRALVSAAEPPRVWALIGASVLQRAPRGNYDVLLRQVDRLLRYDKNRSVTIQLVRDDAPVHLDAPGSFTLLRFTPPELPNVVVLEQVTGTVVLDRRPDVDRYFELMDRIAVTALTPADTLAAIASIRDHIQALHGSPGSRRLDHAGQGTLARSASSPARSLPFATGGALAPA
jgi:transcriptional regulator with XRE-family HTH domain